MPDKYANTKPVGTGPFMLDKFAPTQYTLKKNPTYWQADKIAPERGRCSRPSRATRAPTSST